MPEFSVRIYCKPRGTDPGKMGCNRDMGTYKFNVLPFDVLSPWRIFNPLLHHYQNQPHFSMRCSQFTMVNEQSGEEIGSVAVTHSGRIRVSIPGQDILFYYNSQ